MYFNRAWLVSTSVALCVIALLLLASCKSLTSSIKPSAVSSTLAQQINAEVCASFEYITVDSEFDTKLTVDQAMQHNRVLLAVYHCPIPTH